MEKFRTIRQHKGKAAVLLGLVYLAFLRAGAALRGGASPRGSLPGTEERGGPSGLKRPGQAMDPGIQS